jgi:thioesterase domain-containing protein
LYYLPPTQSASVEEIASHYVKEIKLVQPSGPYCIGGFCAAGSIAFEIARQLKAKGDTIAALVLFEFYYPQAMISRKSLTYRGRKLVQTLQRLVTLIKSNQTPIALSKYFLTKSLTRFKKEFGNAPPRKYVTTPEYHQYVYKPYHGKVVLFQASITPLEFNGSPLMGWSNHFVGEIDIVKIDGGHLGILREPAVETLAGRFKAILEELNTGSK